MVSYECWSCLLPYPRFVYNSFQYDDPAFSLCQLRNRQALPNVPLERYRHVRRSLEHTNGGENIDYQRRIGPS